MQRHIRRSTHYDRLLVPTSSPRLPPDRSSIPTAALVADLVEALNTILDVVHPVAIALPTPPDAPFHESSGHLMDYNNSPQFKAAQSASKRSPLFPEV